MDIKKLNRRITEALEEQKVSDNYMDKIEKVVARCTQEYLGDSFGGTDTWEDSIEIDMHQLDTMKLTEEQYNEWENFLKDYLIETNDYSIYFSFDMGGYEYWHNVEADINMVFLHIYIKTENVDTDKLCKDITKALDDYGTFLLDKNIEYKSQ